MRHHIDMYPSSFERYFHLIRWFFEFLMLLERNPDGSQLSRNYFHSYRAFRWSPRPRDRVWTALHPNCTGRTCGSCYRKHWGISYFSWGQSVPFILLLFSAEALQEGSHSSPLSLGGIFTTKSLRDIPVVWHGLNTPGDDRQVSLTCRPWFCNDNK